MVDYQIFNLGTIALQSGETLPQAQIAYATFGQLNSQRDNVIILPTYYTGTHRSYLPLIGQDRALNPEK